MKKRYLFVSMMVMAAVTLAGCGGNASSSQASSAASSAAAAQSAVTSSGSAETSTVPAASEVQPSADTENTADAASSTDNTADATATDGSSADALDPTAFIGVSIDEFKTTFGEPTSSSYDTGSDGQKVGTYTYDKFTVTTHTNDDGSEVVDSVE